MAETKTPPETRVVLPVDPTRRTEIDKQRVPMSTRPYRLLALVKQDAVVRVQKEPDDTVMTWPHLLTIEFLAAGTFDAVPGSSGVMRGGTPASGETVAVGVSRVGSLIGCTPFFQVREV